MKPSRGKREGPSGRPVAFSRPRVGVVVARTLAGRRRRRPARCQRTSAGRRPRPSGRRREGRAQGNPASVGCYRRASPSARRPGEERSPRLPPREAGRPARAAASPVGDCSQCLAAAQRFRVGVAARDARGPRLKSATFPTRLETRTKESNASASHGAVRNPWAQ